MDAFILIADLGFSIEAVIGGGGLKRGVKGDNPSEKYVPVSDA